MTVTTEARHDRAPLVGEGAVERFAAITSDGFAILDGDRRFVYVNPAGARILQVDADHIVGQPALVFDRRTAAGRARADELSMTSEVPGVDGARLIEYREEQEEDRSYVVFNDATESRRRERQLAAFAQTATTFAEAPTLKEVLDSVALAVLQATGTAASTIVLYDARAHRLGQVGTAGGYPDDYAERLEACRTRGAPLASLEAFLTGEPFLAANWARRVLADPRWAPVHPVIRGRKWGDLAAVPMISRDGAIGALTAFYSGGHTPTPSDLAFLGSIASLVAVAVQNYRLLTELELKAMVEERRRIARDLHDAVSQALFSLTLRCRAVSLADEKDDDEARARVRSGLEEIEDLANSALGEMRTLISQLRPVGLLDGGLLEAVQRHVSSVSAREGLSISVEGERELPLLSGAAELHILRIVQEALNNVVKHSGAGKARVAIGATASGDALEVVVEDDGRGFDPSSDRPGHIGLASMGERCAVLGGELAVSSASDGTTIRVKVPFDAAIEPGGESS